MYVNNKILEAQCVRRFEKLQGSIVGAYEP